MSQESIINLLKRNKGKRYSVKEIMLSLNLNERAAYTNLDKMIGKSVSRVYVYDGETKRGKFLYFISKDDVLYDLKEEAVNPKRIFKDIDEYLAGITTLTEDMKQRMLLLQQRAEKENKKPFKLQK